MKRYKRLTSRRIINGVVTSLTLLLSLSLSFAGGAVDADAADKTAGKTADKAVPVRVYVSAASDIAKGSIVKENQLLESVMADGTLSPSLATCARNVAGQKANRNIAKGQIVMYTDLVSGKSGTDNKSFDKSHSACPKMMIAHATRVLRPFTILKPGDIEMRAMNITDCQPNFMSSRDTIIGVKTKEKVESGAILTVNALVR